LKISTKKSIQQIHTKIRIKLGPTFEHLGKDKLKPSSHSTQIHKHFKAQQPEPTPPNLKDKYKHTQVSIHKTNINLV